MRAKGTFPFVARRNPAKWFRHLARYLVQYASLGLCLSIFATLLASQAGVRGLLDARRAIPNAANTPSLALVRSQTDILTLPLCNRLVLHAPVQYNGFGSQLIRILAGFLAASDMNASWAWFPGAPWNYQCQTGANWDCYFEPPARFCRYRTPGNRWAQAEINDVVEHFLAGADGCEPLSLGERIDQLQTLWSALPQNRTRMVWYPEISGAGSPNTDYGPIQCRSHTRSEDSNLAVRYMTQKFDELPAPAAALAQHRKDMRLLWKPKQNVLDFITQQANDLNLTVPRSDECGASNYISVHLRRGDKDLETPYIPLEFYSAAVKFASSKTGINKVFVASDDMSSLAELAKELAPLKIRAFALDGALRRGGHSQHSFNAKDGMRDLVQDLMTEIEIMAQGAYFIGTSSSAISRVVHMLRPHDEPANTSIFLDRVWNCGLRWRGFDRYCDSKLSWEDSGANRDFCEDHAAMLQQLKVSIEKGPKKSPISSHPFRAATVPNLNDGHGYLVDVSRRSFPLVPNVACERQPIDLSCMRDPNVPGQQIEVISATYGRAVRKWPQCFSQTEAYMSDSNCGISENARAALIARCEGKSVCKVVVSELEIRSKSGEILCPENRKYLNVTYRCV